MNGEWKKKDLHFHSRLICYRMIVIQTFLEEARNGITEMWTLRGHNL